MADRDYKVLLTFAPSFPLWGSAERSGSRRTDHARVIYLAMVEWFEDHGDRSVLGFDAEGHDVFIADGSGRSGAPCSRVRDEGQLFCEGHFTDPDGNEDYGPLIERAKHASEVQWVFEALAREGAPSDVIKQARESALSTGMEAFDLDRLISGSRVKAKS